MAIRWLIEPADSRKDSRLAADARRTTPVRGEEHSVTRRFISLSKQDKVVL